MRTIQLTQGKVAFVDDSDYEWLSQWTWCAHQCGTKWYARRMKDYHLVGMHSELCPHWRLVDHEDGDGLNNQRGNLRPASKQQNGQNSALRKNNRSGYKGVSKHKDGRWMASICVRSGKKTYLGLFDTAQLAARAYDEAALREHGSFAKLNFDEVRLEGPTVNHEYRIT